MPGVTLHMSLPDEPNGDIVDRHHLGRLVLDHVV